MGGGYFMLASRMARRDFLRLALVLGTTPPLAALSYTELTSRRAFAATSLLPATTAARNFFSEVFTRVLTVMFLACLRALLRIRRSADFLLGIVTFQLISKIRRQTVAESPRMSTDCFQGHDLMSRIWKAVTPMIRKVALKPSRMLNDSPTRHHGMGWANR